MALNEAECNQCRIEIGKLKGQYERAGDVPDVAKARTGELEAALERECSSSSDSGAALVGLGVLAAGAVGFTALLMAALLGSRQ